MSVPSDPVSDLIFKIENASVWNAAERAGVYEGSQLDKADGFIHFSSAEQSRETFEKHFAGQTNLVLIAVRTADLGDALKWETSRGGALFPHLYGTLFMDAVEGKRALPDGGGFISVPEWGIV
ncbi:MAG: DUF952 domain-containing protein [Pseudomonadota bacterium]